MRSDLTLVIGGVLLGGVLFATALAQGESSPSTAASQNAATASAQSDASTDQLSLRDLRKILRSPDMADELAGAVAQLQSMIDAGDAQAALLLGTEYTRDRGTLPLDYDKATSYLEQAGALGMPQAYLTLANMHRREDGDLARPKTLDYLKLAADAGLTKAYMPLADAYRRGIYAEPDTAQAIKYYTAALEAGDVTAARRLMAIYRTGTGSVDDEKMALKYLRISADAGDISAMRAMSNMYLRGLGVPEDKALAEQYLRAALDAGDDSAKPVLGTALIRNQFGDSREAEGVALLQSSFDAGDASAAAVLADAYLRGKGVEANAQKAQDILLGGSKAGDINAMAGLLTLYVRGMGRALPPDLAAAHALYDTIPPDQRTGTVAANGALLAAGGKSNADFANTWALFDTLDTNLQARTGLQILRTNPNAYVYVLQSLMTEQGQYAGELTGMLTSSTISAVNRFCADHDITMECRFGPLARTTWQAIAEKGLDG
ncbi:MAG: tetratricopeptide repeat protein [Devosia sp.]